MNLLIFCSLHFAYGAAIAFAAAPRMRAEGVVLGWPLIVSLVPVALISTPISGILVRFAPNWFFSLLPWQNWTIEFERFHFGVLFFVASLVALSMLAGNFIAIASISRGVRRWALFPFGAFGLALLIALVLAPHELVYVEPERFLWTHPVGICLLATVICLVGIWIFVKSRFSAPVATFYE